MAPTERFELYRDDAGLICWRIVSFPGHKLCMGGPYTCVDVALEKIRQACEYFSIKQTEVEFEGYHYLL